MDVLVETILSQHTSDKNSHRAYLSLRRALPRWETVADASLSDIEDAIRCGGLARQKARIIKNTLAEIRSREGRVSLRHLRKMDDEAIYAYLTSLPGIGSKTACCVKLFALGRQVMPVDTHIHRITKRLEWIAANGTPEHARIIWERRLERAALYHAHVLLIAHGRQCCRARAPLCSECPVRKHCPTGLRAKKTVRPR
jgi:endonuclease III